MAGKADRIATPRMSGSGSGRGARLPRAFHSPQLQHFVGVVFKCEEDGAEASEKLFPAPDIDVAVRREARRQRADSRVGC
jgi:hypothetical protein